MSRYSALDPSAINATLEALERRIVERFPKANLGKVAHELLEVGRLASVEAPALERPILPIRVCSALLIAGLVLLLMLAFSRLRFEGFARLNEWIPLLESAVNDAIFMALAVFFLAGWEARLKRAKALAAIHRLRSLAHIVDMHQLTKDPEFLLDSERTASSPERSMSRLELSRYLDYCSELLSLTSKLAALYVQHFPDGSVQAAVNEVVTLTTGLSGKIWQKIVILDTLAFGAQKGIV